MSKNSKKVALVTGASSGIGAAIAERLVNAGYRVFGTSRRTTLVAGSHSFEMLSLDITSDESIDAAVNELVQQVGRIGRFSLYVLANTFIPPNNHDFASLRRCSFTRNHAK